MPPNPPRFPWPDTSEGGAPLLMRLHRWRQEPRPSPQHGQHCHDYFEFFWVDEGPGRHPVNGQMWQVETGDIVFIRPDDVHGHRTVGDQSWGWTNVMVQRAVAARLKRRFGGSFDAWPWGPGALPTRVRLTAGQLSELQSLLAMMPVDVFRMIDAEWFIAGLLRVLYPRGRAHALQTPPQWLADAIEQYKAALARHGDGGDFVAATGRSREHVNRVIRKHFDKTTNQLLIDIRLQRAARLLRMTGSDILTVAAESGFENASYFHRRFKRRFGTSPRRFRTQHGV